MRTMTLRGIFTLAFLLALSTATSYAQSHVSGTVVDAQNKPVQGAVILFDMKDRAMKRETKTDKKGEYLFIGLPTGDYTVTASKDGLTDSATTNISGAAKVKVNFTLQPATVVKKAVGTGLEAAGTGNLATTERPKDKNEYAELQATAAAALEAFKANRHDEAATKLTDVVAKMPNCADCYLYLGVSLYETQKLPEAEAAFKKSVELQPSVEGYTALVRYYNAQKQFDLAAEMGKKAADLAAAPPAPPPAAAGAAAGGAATAPPPPSPSASSETAFNQGAILWNAKKYAEAKPMFEAAIKANPENAEAHYMLAMASLNVGQLNEARTAFQNYLKVAPNGPKAAEVKKFLTELPK
jgi:Flp pilus assembly protein TadD